MIYAAEILNQKFIKIGFSDDETCISRIASLQTGNPFKISILFVVKGSLIQEQALHSSLRVAFGRIRIPMPPNEWYPGKNPFFQKFLEHLRFGADLGLSYMESYNPSVRQPGKKLSASTEPTIKWPNW